jgi:hypothetical protein
MKGKKEKKKEKNIGPKNLTGRDSVLINSDINNH